MLFSGKNILITGGTSALGQSIVKRALELEARVFFTWHKNEAIADSLEKLGARAVKVDLASADEIQSFAQKLIPAIRALHGLVHNAAATRDSVLERLSLSDWDDVMKVNVKAPFLLTQQLMPALKKAKPARIVALTSRAATSGVYGASNYATSKAALEAWVKSLAREQGKEMLVNAVNPGFMISEMTKSIPEKAKEFHQNLSPLKKFSNPHNVAKWILNLLSDDNEQMSGQIFNLESRMQPMMNWEQN